MSELRATLALWQARVADAERNAQASQATLVTYRRQLDVMTADDLLLVSLSGLPPANAAQAKAFVSRSQNAILFTARDLPSLPAARVYQLWAVAGGQAISAGTFVPDARGRSQLVADVPALTDAPRCAGRHRGAGRRRARTHRSEVPARRAGGELTTPRRPRGHPTHIGCRSLIPDP